MVNVFHVLHHYKRLTGYSVRSRYIMKYQKEAGLNVDYISVEDYILKHIDNVFSNEFLEHCKFKALKAPLYVIRRIYYMKLLKESLIHKLRRFKPTIIHVHSPWELAADAIKLIKSTDFRIPIVCEVRGLWEETAVALEAIRRSPLYLIAKKQEKYVLTNADAIVAISEHLKGYLSSKGVDKDKIVVIPNGVDTSFFKPLPKNRGIMSELGISFEDIVIGYIGSIRKIEGLDILIEAVKHLQPQNTKIIIMGEGEYRRDLVYKVRQLKLERNIKLLKSVPPKDILKYYSVLDIFVIPRRRFYVNELVTPLKPLEAMAMEKCIIASNVGGLKEIVHDGVTGLLFEADNVEDLIQKINLAIVDNALRERLAKNAREWVVKHRNWKHLVNNYIKLYASLT